MLCRFTFTSSPPPSPLLRRFLDALPAYEQALEVFEMVVDVDKVTKALVNLANMAELQVGLGSHHFLASCITF